MTKHSAQDANNTALESSITKALERQPEVAMPVGFAARVRASLPAQPVARRRWSAATAAGAGAAVLLTAALLWLSPHAAPEFTNLAFDMELMLLAELAGVATWLAMRRQA